MNPSPVVFIDTSAFVALVNHRDTNHQQAHEILARTDRERRLRLTSNFVRAETHGLIISRVGRDPATEFLKRVPSPDTRVMRATAEDEMAGQEIVLRYTDKSFSLVDGISFAIMSRLGISTAFAFDRDFLQYGFETLQP